MNNQNSLSKYNAYTEIASNYEAARDILFQKKLALGEPATVSFYYPDRDSDPEVRVVKTMLGIGSINGTIMSICDILGSDTYADGANVYVSERGEYMSLGDAINYLYRTTDDASTLAGKLEDIDNTLTGKLNTINDSLLAGNATDASIDTTLSTKLGEVKGSIVDLDTHIIAEFEKVEAKDASIIESIDNLAQKTETGDTSINTTIAALDIHDTSINNTLQNIVTADSSIQRNISSLNSTVANNLSELIALIGGKGGLIDALSGENGLINTIAGENGLIASISGKHGVIDTIYATMEDQGTQLDNIKTAINGLFIAKEV